MVPWPRPQDTAPPLPEGGGAWHVEGWFGAVLTGHDLTTHPDGAKQAVQLEAFLASAISECRQLLGA